MEEKTFEAQNIFGKGEENTAYAQYFIGKSYLNPLTSAGVKPFFANVTFEPSCRNNWHIHRAESGGGQRLVPGMGQACAQSEPRRRGGNSCKRQALARREKGQLVFAHSRRTCRRKYL